MAHDGGPLIFRDELNTTIKLLADIASAANNGLSKPVIASGIATALYMSAQPRF